MMLWRVLLADIQAEHRCNRSKLSSQRHNQEQAAHCRHCAGLHAAAGTLACNHHVLEVRSVTHHHAADIAETIAVGPLIPNHCQGSQPKVSAKS